MKIVGAIESIQCHITGCPGCGELRYEEIPCLACDLPDHLAIGGNFRCNCFDWPDDPEAAEHGERPAAGGTA